MVQIDSPGQVRHQKVLPTRTHIDGANVVDANPYFDGLRLQVLRVKDLYLARLGRQEHALALIEKAHVDHLFELGP